MVFAVFSLPEAHSCARQPLSTQALKRRDQGPLAILVEIAPHRHRCEPTLTMEAGHE